MSSSVINFNTDLEPSYYLKNDDNTDIDNLTEVFLVVFKEDRGTFREPKEHYYFFNDFKKAYNCYKIIGSSQSLIKRIYTDDEKLISLCNMTTINIPENEVVEGEVKTPENEEGSIKRITEAKDTLYSA